MTSSSAKPLSIPDDVKREAFHLSLAVEELIYGYDDRIGMAAFVALGAAFQNLVEHLEMNTDALTLFAEVLQAVTAEDFALDENDPSVRGYVHPEHVTIN